MLGVCAAGHSIAQILALRLRTISTAARGRFGKQDFI
jgi:hypothetical protein